MQQQAGQRARDQRGDGRTAEEDGNRLATLDAGQPAGEVVDHAWKETGLGHAEQKTQNVEVGFGLDKGHAGRDDAPGQHDPRQPDTCADFLQQDVGRDFEEGIADEKQSGTQAIGSSADTQVMLHVRTHEADVDPVDVVDDEHDDEKRQDVTFDLRYG